MSVFSEQTQESVCFISLARSHCITRTKKINTFFSVNVAFSSLDVGISSLVSQQGKAISLFPFSLLFRTEKNPQSGRACAPGGSADQSAGDPPPTDGLWSFFCPHTRSPQRGSRVLKGGPGGNKPLSVYHYIRWWICLEWVSAVGQG